MVFSRVSFINGLLALQICVVLMVGSLDSTSSSVPVTPTPPLSPRKLRHRIAVEGVVFCKSCKFGGVETLLGASPLPEAVVKLQCNNGKHGIVVEGKTDKNGYFFIQPAKVTAFGAHKCQVFLVSSPLAKCKLPTDLNGGVSGASLLFRTELKGPTTLALYSVGPFAFAPTRSFCPLSP